MADNLMNAKWNIVLTKTGYEKKVAGYFAKNQIEYYWPLNTFQADGNDRRKAQQEPLFKSYVFVRIVESQVAKVLRAPGIRNFVYWLSKPAIIKEAEIETIRFFLNQYRFLHIEKTEVDINENVKNVKGSTISKAGNVTEMLHNSNKAILPSIGYILISQQPEMAHNDKVIFNNPVYKTADILVAKEQF